MGDQQKPNRCRNRGSISFPAKVNPFDDTHSPTTWRAPKRRFGRCDQRTSLLATSWGRDKVVETKKQTLFVNEKTQLTGKSTIYLYILYIYIIYILYIIYIIYILYIYYIYIIYMMTRLFQCLSKGDFTLSCLIATGFPGHPGNWSLQWACELFWVFVLWSKIIISHTQILGYTTFYGTLLILQNIILQSSKHRFIMLG